MDTIPFIFYLEIFISRRVGEFIKGKFLDTLISSGEEK